MAMNLLSLVTQFLTPDMVRKIASALGLDRTSAQDAIGGSIPALMTGLAGAASEPGGVRQLSNVLAQQKSGWFDDIMSAIGGSGQRALTDSGSSMLSSLLGASNRNALVGAISRFSGLGQHAATPLLGMMAPVVMDTIAQQQGSARTLDPGKIANLLAGQKDNIAAAMPPALRGMLSGTGLLDSLGGAARSAGAMGGDAARASSYAARDVANTGQRVGRSASNNWLYWLLPAAALAALLIYIVAKPTEPVVSQQNTAASQQQNTAASQTTGVQSPTAAGIDVGKQLTDSVSGLRSTLGGITDAASAQAALPKLQESTTQLDKVNDMTQRLSTDQRKLVSGVAANELPGVNALFDKILALPGLPNQLKPVIEALRTKLTSLAA